MKDANDLMVVALQMYRLLERGVARKDGDGRTAHASFDLHEKGAVMGIINSLFQAEIQEQQLRIAEQRRLQLMGNRPALTPDHMVADEYQQ